MNVKTFAVSTSVLALALTASSVALRAQGPLYDKVTVNLPYSVTVGDKTLEAGDYTIEQLPSSANTHVMLIYSDNGQKFEATATTIAAVEKQPPSGTQVILHHIGDDYYFDKIWIQGKDYGYEFPLPGNVKEREKEQSVSVAATYSQTNTNESATSQQTTTAETTTPQQPATTPETTTETAPEATPEAAPAPAPTPAPDAAENQPTSEPAQTEATTSEPTQSETAASEPNTANREMPHTSAGWLMMLLSGGALSGAGWVLRRRG